MVKYQDVDGTIIELSYDEYINRPFNSRLVLVEDDELSNEFDSIENDKVVKVEDLNGLTKEELNDYAVSLGLDDEVTFTMKKGEMIAVIKDHLNG